MRKNLNFFFLKLIVLNYFLKKSVLLIKNKPLSRFQSRFVNSNLVKYTLTKKIMSHKIYFFNYLNYVKGSNYQWLGSGRVVKSYKPFMKKPFYKLGVPWALAFLRGYFFNMSYKKIIRRKIFGVSKINTFLDRIKVSNYMIKNYVVWKKYSIKNKNINMSKKNLFFNNDFIIEANKRFVKNFFFKNVDYKVKAEARLKYLTMKRLLKDKINSSIGVKSLLNSDYFFDENETAYVDKHKFIKLKFQKYGVLYYLRKKFRKSIFLNVLKRKKYVKMATKKIKISLFKTLHQRLNLLCNNLSVNGNKLSQKDLVISHKNEFKAVKENRKGLLFNNPFNNYLNNFLFFFNYPKYLFLTKKKEKKAVDLNSYLVPKTLYDENLLKMVSMNKSIKLIIFLKIYIELLALNVYLKKKIFIYRNELSIFLFKSFWSLEFYKIYFNFKFRRLNFEKLFKKSRNNVYAKKYVRSSMRRITKLKNAIFKKKNKEKISNSFGGIRKVVSAYNNSVILKYLKKKIK